MVQARHQALSQIHTAELVCHRNAKRNRLCAAAVEVARACGALHQQILTRLILPGIILAVAGDLPVNNAGVDGLHGFIIQMEPLCHLRPEIDDHGICLFQKRTQLFPLCRVFQIYADAFLVPVHIVIRAVISPDFQSRAVIAAIGIACTGPLYLDDPCAQISQTERCERASQKLAEIQNCKAL